MSVFVLDDATGVAGSNSIQSSIQWIAPRPVFCSLRLLDPLKREEIVKARLRWPSKAYNSEESHETTNDSKAVPCGSSSSVEFFLIVFIFDNFVVQSSQGRETGLLPEYFYSKIFHQSASRSEYFAESILAPLVPNF